MAQQRHECPGRNALLNAIGREGMPEHMGRCRLGDPRLVGNLLYNRNLQLTFSSSSDWFKWHSAFRNFPIICTAGDAFLPSQVSFRLITLPYPNTKTNG